MAAILSQPQFVKRNGYDVTTLLGQLRRNWPPTPTPNPHPTKKTKKQNKKTQSGFIQSNVSKSRNNVQNVWPTTALCDGLLLDLTKSLHVYFSLT